MEGTIRDATTGTALYDVLLARFGFERVGLLRRFGFKVGAWHDVAILQKDLAPPTPTPVEPR